MLSYFQEQNLNKAKVRSLGVSILNQNNITELDKPNEKDFFDEETEFLLEEYDQSSTIDDYDETLDEKVHYEGVKVNINV